MQLNLINTPVPFTDQWYNNLNIEYSRGPEGAYMTHNSVNKVAEAIRDMLKAKGESLTANEILDRIDKKRYYCIFAKHLGKALRGLPGIEYAYIPPEKRNKQGDIYLYSYRDGESAYRDPEGKLWGAHEEIKETS